MLSPAKSKRQHAKVKPSKTNAQTKRHDPHARMPCSLARTPCSPHTRCLPRRPTHQPNMRACRPMCGCSQARRGDARQRYRDVWARQRPRALRQLLGSQGGSRDLDAKQRRSGTGAVHSWDAPLCDDPNCPIARVGGWKRALQDVKARMRKDSENFTITNLKDSWVCDCIAAAMPQAAGSSSSLRAGRASRRPTLTSRRLPICGVCGDVLSKSLELGPSSIVTVCNVQIEV